MSAGGGAAGSGTGPRRRTALARARGGPIRRAGDRTLAELCAGALDVVASDEPLPLTHGFHSFAARFHPEMARRLLAAHPLAQRVLDPFAGSGTTLVEAAAAGRAGIGSDLNPLAVRLARLKATPVGGSARARLVENAAAVCARVLAAGKAARRAGAAPAAAGPATRFDDPRLYPPHVYRELVALRLAIDEAAGPAASAHPERWLREALLLVLSSIVIKFSRQRSDTDARLVEPRIGRGAPARLFAARAGLLAEQLAALAIAVPPGTLLPDVRRADARHLDHVATASIDLAITSPPYLGTYDYSDQHARRYGWIDVDAAAVATFRAGEVGARRAVRGASAATAVLQWQAEVEAWLAELGRVLAPGGYAFVLVGDSRAGGRAIAGDAAVRQAAAQAGLTLRASASQERPRPGSDAAADTPREHLLALALK